MLMSVQTYHRHLHHHLAGRSEGAEDSGGSRVDVCQDRTSSSSPSSQIKRNRQLEKFCFNVY